MQVSMQRVTYQALKDAGLPIIVVCDKYRFYLSANKNPEVTLPDGTHYALIPNGHDGVGVCWVLYYANDVLRVTDNLREETIDISVASPEAQENYLKESWGDYAACFKDDRKRKILLLCN